MVVFNPFAGRRGLERRIARVRQALADGGFDTEALASRLPGDATNRAREAAAKGAEVVFSLGGDGTLRECAAGLLGSSTALAFLPVGTINVMALELGIPRRPVAAARAYRHATTRQFGVGLVGSTPFLMQASAGVDAFLIAAMKPGEKKWLGRASPVPAILRSLARYTFPTFEVSTASGKRTATLAVASNIQRYGGPWKLTPAARSAGESLELFCFSGRGRAAAIRLALSLAIGAPIAGGHTERVSHATFESKPGLPAQVDGDVLPARPGRAVDITLSNHRISMLVPAR